MKLLVVNGSPKGANGNTATITEAFLSGANEAGAESEIVYLNDKRIEHCIGCFNCWTKTPGVCVHKDDMAEILLKVRQADMVVYATPLYVYTVSGLMKDFMDRSIPLVQPFMDVDDGLCRHPARYSDLGEKSVVLISNSGFPELAHFSGLKETFHRCFRGSGRGIAGIICCAAGVLLSAPELKDGAQWYLDAARQAGREVIERGRISDETQKTLDRPLMEDQELFARMANAGWRSMGVKRIGENPVKSPPTSAPESARPLDPPVSMDTMRDLAAGMALTFNGAAAGDLRAVVQFVVTDEEPGRYFLDISGGKCTAYAGEHPTPSMTISTPSSVWVGISKGEINGATAFMTGQYTVAGDMALLMQFEKLFPTG